MEWLAHADLANRFFEQLELFRFAVAANDEFYFVGIDLDNFFRIHNLFEFLRRVIRRLLSLIDETEFQIMSGLSFSFEFCEWSFFFHEGIDNFRSSFGHLLLRKSHASPDNFRLTEASFPSQRFNKEVQRRLESYGNRLSLCVVVHRESSRINPYPLNTSCWRRIRRTERRTSSETLMPVALAAAFKNASSSTPNRTGFGPDLRAVFFISTHEYNVEEKIPRKIVDGLYTILYKV